MHQCLSSTTAGTWAKTRPARRFGPASARSGPIKAAKGFAQFITVCRRSKWSSHRTNSPLRALLATEGSKAACKGIVSRPNLLS